MNHDPEPTGIRQRDTPDTIQVEDLRKVLFQVIASHCHVESNDFEARYPKPDRLHPHEILDQASFIEDFVAQENQTNDVHKNCDPFSAVKMALMSLSKSLPPWFVSKNDHTLGERDFDVMSSGTVKKKVPQAWTGCLSESCATYIPYAYFPCTSLPYPAPPSRPTFQLPLLHLYWLATPRTLPYLTYSFRP